MSFENGFGGLRCVGSDALPEFRKIGREFLTAVEFGFGELVIHLIAADPCPVAPLCGYVVPQRVGDCIVHFDPYSVFVEPSDDHLRIGIAVFCGLFQ